MDVRGRTQEKSEVSLKKQHNFALLFSAQLQTCSQVRPTSARSAEDIGNHASPRTLFHPGGPQASGRHFTEHDLPVAPIGRAGQCRHRLPPIHLRRGDHGADHPVDDQRQPRTSLNPIVQEAPRCSPPSLTTGPRAAERGMKPSTYLAAMARAHVAADPPLSANELAALKQSIVILSGVGTLLAQSARNPALSGPGLEDVRQTLSRMRVAVATLEQRTHDFAKAALMAWESRFE